MITKGFHNILAGFHKILIRFEQDLMVFALLLNHFLLVRGFGLGVAGLAPSELKLKLVNHFWNNGFSILLNRFLLV